jgi:CHAT domain-containing protein/Tfp pilus assembly protein PilF
MKNNLILTFFFSLFFSVSMAQNGQDSVIYTLADTVVANKYSKDGSYYASTGDYDKAIAYYDSSLVIRIQLLGKEHPKIAALFNNLGIVCWSKGDYDEALEFHEKALKIRLKILGTNHTDVAITYSNMGNIYFSKGYYNKALELYEKALAIRLKSLGFEHQDVATSFNNLGVTYSTKGNYTKAIDYYEKALTIKFKLFGSGHSNLAVSYNNLGIIYSDKMDYDKAIEYYQKALIIMFKTLGSEHPNIATSYNNIGNANNDSGNYDKAIEYIEKALAIQLKRLGEVHPDIALSYNNLGLSYYYKKDYQKAIAYHTKSMDIRLKTLGAEHPDVAASYNNLGIIYKNKGDYDKAIEYCKKSLGIELLSFGTNSIDVIETFNNLGNIHTLNKNYKEGLEYYQKALFSNHYDSRLILDSVMDINHLITSLYELINTHTKQYTQTQDTTHLSQAYDLSNQALKAVAYQFKTLNTEGSKAALLKSSIGVSENALNINQLMANVKDDKKLLIESFNHSERAKSLILFGSLRETDALSYAGIPDSLLQKESDLRIDIAFYEKRRFEEESKGKEAKDSIVNSYNSQLFDLKRSYETLKERFEKDYPDYYRLKYDLSVVGVEEVQQKLLTPDQTLLEYFVGDSSVFIFTLNKDSYKVLEIKKDFPLDSLVDAMRHGIYDAFTNKKDSLTMRTMRYVNAATQLYDKLVAPVKPILRGSVIIVPDGALGYIPFDALLKSKPDNIARAQNFDYLLNDHKISYCYSATILKDMVNKKHRQEPTQPFLAMAPYFKGDTATIKSDSLDLMASLNDLRPSGLRNSLDSLPYTGEEVTRLQRIMGGEAVVGKEATEAIFTKKASNARIIHLSTHGKMDDKVGDYSYLAFTEQADSIENEWLYTRELYNLSLNADMVVLSACETGIGKLQRGEGIISLARAFAYAGAKSIVTTLWQVRDESTKDIMLLFYQNLKKGKDKDEALWLAKKAYIKGHKKELALPFFWSGIIPIGDMRPIGKY